MKRRRFLGLASAVLASSGCRSEALPTGPPGRSAVAVLRAASYSADLLDLLTRGAQLCNLEVRGKRVLLKPNLVEFNGSAPINTHPALVAAALELFRRLGAAEVWVGEGPGHRRDTRGLAEEAGYGEALPMDDLIDLNRDDITPVANFAGMERIYLPDTALRADLIVSLAKMKTHHWAGATLSMKNLFGLLPGSIYGWPKNQLHYLGIDRAVAELQRLFPRAFAIVDGIVGMEGNGPIQGTAKPCGVVVMGEDLVAVDSTCCRIMGLRPEEIGYIRMVAERGHAQPGRIEQRGERWERVRSDFAVIKEFEHLRLGPIP